MAFHSSLLIIIIVFAVLFSMFYFASDTGNGYSPSNFAVVTTPKVTEEQAVNILAAHLQDKWWVSKILASMRGQGYKHYSDFRAKGISIPLVFTHRNGTMFFVNSTTNHVFLSCANTEENAFACPYSTNFVNESRGHLVYAFDMAISSTDGCSGPDFFIVDALSGDILFSFIDKRPDSMPKGCLR